MNAMPAYRGELDDGQVADASIHLRSSSGNRAAAVGPDAVAAHR